VTGSPGHAADEPEDATSAGMGSGMTFTVRPRRTAAAARPVRHRPGLARRGPRDHHRDRRAARRRRRPHVRSASGGVPDTYYGETPRRDGVVPLLLESRARSRTAGARCRSRAALDVAGARWRRRSAITGPRSARSTSPSTTWSASDTECPFATCRRAGRDPAHGPSRWARRPAVVAERARRASDFPASRQARRPGRRRDPRGGARRVPGPIRATQHRLDPVGALALLPSWAPRRGAIEQPFPAGRLDQLRTCRRDPGCPWWRTRAPSRSRTSMGWWGS